MYLYIRAKDKLSVSRVAFCLQTGLLSAACALVLEAIDKVIMVLLTTVEGNNC